MINILQQERDRANVAAAGSTAEEDPSQQNIHVTGEEKKQHSGMQVEILKHNP